MYIHITLCMELSKVLYTGVITLSNLSWSIYMYNVYKYTLYTQT